MEIGLIKERTPFYRKLADSAFDHEETKEIIVPDTLPDISGIVDASGIALLRSKDSQSGRIVINGTVQGSVLYLPEGMHEIKAIPVQLPFSFNCETSGSDTTSRTIVTAALTRLEARTINSRKLLLRADIGVNVKAFEPAEAVVTVSAQAEVEVLKETITAMPAVEIGEKTFTIREETELPATGAPLGKLLRGTSRIIIEEVKPSGKRLAVRGRTEINILYLSQTSGEISSAQFFIPFLQVTDTEAGEGICDAQAEIMQTGAYITVLDPEEATPHKISIEIAAVLQMTVRRQISLISVRDIYSTSYETSYENANCVLDGLMNKERHDLAIRELLPFADVKNILETRAIPGRARYETGQLIIPIRAAVLTVGEDRIPTVAEGRYEMSCEISLPEKKHGISVKMTDITAVPAAGGVELRASANVEIRIFEASNIQTVESAYLGDTPPAGSALLPSIIVARAGHGDTLWSLAKRYNSTREMIASANDLSEESEISENDLLIIAKSR